MSHHPFSDPDDYPLPAISGCPHPPHPGVKCLQYEADVLGIGEAPDDLKRFFLCHMEYSAREELRIQASADQTGAAFSAVAAANGLDTSTATLEFSLHAGRSSSVRDVLTATMDVHRELTAMGTSGMERVIYSEADYDPSNPAHAWSVPLGLVAGDPVHVQVLYDGPRQWLRDLSGQRMICQWPQVHERFAQRCLSHTRHVIAWARGQYLIAVPTCNECRRALGRTGPTSANVSAQQ
ncbi:hypothetical protein [Mycolicibacterium diernhoferi]|uniref:hypothetical protein n=1 Tax=Mycolicibacterium diernhoferi TaxID=1801 RepID=UPI001041DBA6|nr:hypothetical protein [Mycolicibacterium diernhoferi]QYL21246.1 hypothetical protein K0O62_19740 [Mycolicibacterium diernhoferi]